MLDTEIKYEAKDELGIMADGMRESLSALKTYVADISVSGIAEASETQSETVSQVMQGINQISCVVQTSSATSEESAATSEELSAQAKTLQELIGQFKLPSAGGVLSGSPRESLPYPRATKH